LEIAVNDVARVGGGHRLTDGHHDLECFLSGKSSSRRGEVLLEDLAREELLNDERSAVVVAGDVENVDDVGMAHGGGGARLSQKPEDVIGVLGHLAAQDLDRYLAPERHVGRAVDLAHAADAKAVLEQVFSAD